MGVYVNTDLYEPVCKNWNRGEIRLPYEQFFNQLRNKLETSFTLPSLVYLVFVLKVRRIPNVFINTFYNPE